jgi:hypothetical protein
MTTGVSKVNAAERLDRMFNQFFAVANFGGWGGSSVGDAAYEAVTLSPSR